MESRPEVAGATEAPPVILPRRVPASANLHRSRPAADDVFTRVRRACSPWAPSVVVSLALLALMGIGAVSAAVFLKATRGRILREALALRGSDETSGLNATVSTMMLTAENLTTVVLQGSDADYIPL